MLYVIQLFTIFLLILLNGFFVAAEFSLISVRKSRIAELVKKGNTYAEKVQEALDDVSTTLTTAQIGVTFASLALGWIGEPFIANLLQQSLSFILPKTVALISSHTAAIIIAFAVITYFHILLGEIVPKTIALQQTENVSFFIITPLTFFTKLFKPFILLLNYSGVFALKLLGLSSASIHQRIHSEEEVKIILDQSSQSGIFKKNEVEMVYNIFKMSDTTVRKIMVPRSEIISFNITTSLNGVAKRIEKNLHSRFPVYKYRTDNISGFIHIKDFYRCLLTNNPKTKLYETNILRKIISIPENKKVDELLLLMRMKWIHLAVIHNEYGETSGIVTLEDVIEAVTGDIQDEFDAHIKEIHREKNGNYLIHAQTSLDRIRNKFKLRLENQNFNTIGGLVFTNLGKIPKKGDKTQIEDMIFEVAEVSKKRIKTIRLKLEKNKRKQLNIQKKSTLVIN